MCGGFESPAGGKVRIAKQDRVADPRVHPGSVWSMRAAGWDEGKQRPITSPSCASPRQPVCPAAAGTPGRDWRPGHSCRLLPLAGELRQGAFHELVEKGNREGRIAMLRAVARPCCTTTVTCRTGWHPVYWRRRGGVCCRRRIAGPVEGRTSPAHRDVGILSRVRIRRINPGKIPINPPATFPSIPRPGCCSTGICGSRPPARPAAAAGRPGWEWPSGRW